MIITDYDAWWRDPESKRVRQYARLYRIARDKNTACILKCEMDHAHEEEVMAAIKKACIRLKST